MSDFHRIPIKHEQAAALTEVLLETDDLHVVRCIVEVLIAYNESVSKDLMWRMEDE